ncbi:sigma-54 dependent transcriptional regulator [uncultured Proteiniphilum sp.]|uniref:sigma-54-dependent transcriptional regulator n=1 Tax=uncultured Proteiniphilum sp. TaxID=497637 RepID=UPI00261EABA3|nr:sigma-54 dependent transcriptional regulator [uncultured Proteiniphilum sp.]
MRNGRILIVEDDRSFGAMLQKWFERKGFPATLCSGMVAAQEALDQTEPYQVVLSDLRLPDGDGIMLLNWLNEKRLSIPVIIMTGYGEIQTAVSAIKLGAFDFLEKPVNPDILTKKIEAAFEARQKNISPPEKQPTERKPYKESREFVEGQSLLSTQMYTHIDLVAPTQMAVMIIGESGTGKEHVARLIHSRSNRANGPFIAVDCGSLSIELAPSELFGHKKGSFTSAIEDKTGFFREAHGGTLFLDEVGNLPYGVQMQLLRTLQEKKVRPVGTSTDLSVDVRIIIATNENLEKAIDEGNFREDLYHRLNEFMIRVPSLRECAEDIPSYADHFREEANRELGREVSTVSPEALALLKAYAWPGNLRELRNVIRRAVLFTKGDAITPDSLPVLSAKKEESLPEADVSLSVEPEKEKEKILRALQQVRGNKTKAAILLQIDRKTLYNKIHQYNISL